MKNSIEENRRLQKEKRTDRKHELFNIEKAKPVKKLRVEKASESDLAKIRKRIEMQNQRSFLRLLIFLIVTIPTVTGGIYWAYKNDVLLKTYRRNRVIAVEWDRIRAEEAKQKEFLMLTLDANEWFEKGNYNNAIIQYSKALALYPKDSVVLYDLTLSYSNNCFQNQETCSEAADFVQRTLKVYPEDFQLNELNKMYEKMKSADN